MSGLQMPQPPSLFDHAEFERFLERCNQVAPDLNNEKTVRSAASWFVEWQHDPEKVERLLNAIR